MHKGLERVLAERKRLREEVLRTAHELVRKLRERLGKVTVVLYGSFARGDFNLWSDVDLIIVSNAFAGVPPLKRYDMVMDLMPPRFEPVLWTADEARVQLSKPWWREALRHRVVLADDYGLFAQST